MIEDNYKLYAGEEMPYYPTFDKTKGAGKEYMTKEAYLRIEILEEIGPGEADWWAYEYEKKTGGRHLDAKVKSALTSRSNIVPSAKGAACTGLANARRLAER